MSLRDYVMNALCESYVFASYIEFAVSWDYVTETVMIKTWVHPNDSDAASNTIAHIFDASVSIVVEFKYKTWMVTGVRFIGGTPVVRVDVMVMNVGVARVAGPDSSRPHTIVYADFLHFLDESLSDLDTITRDSVYRHVRHFADIYQDPRWLEIRT
jgi:hypothetical protein